MAELKKCPFCGGEAKEILILGRDGVGCVECGAMFRAGWEEEAKDVVNRWNNRETESEIRAKAYTEVVEKLELEISESLIWGMLPVDCKDSVSEEIVDYVISTAKQIAEQLKERE